jgi:hypothetical protein
LAEHGVCSTEAAADIAQAAAALTPEEVYDDERRGRRSSASRDRRTDLTRDTALFRLKDLIASASSAEASVRFAHGAYGERET